MLFCTSSGARRPVKCKDTSFEEFLCWGEMREGSLPAPSPP